MTNYKFYLAITIEAEVMHAVNAVGMEKQPLLEVSKPRKPDGRFVASHPASPPRPPTELNKRNVTITVFTAEVGVNVDEKLCAELLRSTKKKPPAWLKYHLIYVGVCWRLDFLRAYRVSFEDWEGRVRSKSS